MGRALKLAALIARGGMCGSVCGALSGLFTPLGAQAAEPAAGELMLAWRDSAGSVHTATLDAQGHALATPRTQWSAQDRVPLGSLWKLAAYARLSEAQADEPPYQCKGGLRDEVYCCEPGQRIDRSTALWRSCGLYFEPARLRWDALPRGDTLAQLPPSLHALATGPGLRSDTRVPLHDWLAWLSHWPAATQQAAQSDLLSYWLQGPGRAALGEVGSRLRLKTFTVERREAQGQLKGRSERWAGASGWTSDGTPLWMAARGSSAAVVPQWAAHALAHIDAARAEAGDAPRSSNAASPCIDVDFFSRYPVANITPAAAPLATSGRLPAGRYRLRFANGNPLDIESAGELQWQRNAQSGIALTGRYALDDYVARVVDREGTGEPAAAAQALAVAARSYVLARATPRDGCLHIADSSSTQRVAPRPASPAAHAAVRHTANLVLHGAEGRFHATQASANVMSWMHAVQSAQQGQGFDRLLHAAYPAATLRTLGGTGHAECEPLPLAQAWLARQQAAWHRRLQAEPGFSVPARVQVCRLQQGRPHALRASGRIYASGMQSLEERLTLAHEYLHLAFSGHPRGRDERFIEQRARQLMGIDG